MVGLIGINRGLNKGLSSSGGGGAPVSPYLDGVLASCICDLDATISDSYGGTGQTWSNLITSPSTGELQTDYDFHLGADSSSDTTDPTFTGTAGTTSAYFSHDGGDFFTCKDNATYLSNAYRTDISNPTTIVVCLQLASTAFQYLFGQGEFNTNRGWSLRMNSGTLQTLAYGDVTFANETVKSSPSIAATTDTCFIFSVDQNAGTGKQAINSTTMTAWTTSGVTFTGPASTSWSFLIGAALNNASPIKSGSRVYHFSAFNEVFDDTKTSAVVSHLNTRHNRTYA